MSGQPGGPGEAFADLVAVMDRLRSPGGCPWDAEQTHASLARYAVEEAFELVEAIETGDRAHLREELGDLLLQVVFHARVAQEHPDSPFSLDDVAAAIAAKLRRRHPHVFDAPAGQDVLSADGVAQRWDDLKRAEGRTSALDGVPVALPALARAQAVLRRSGGLGRRAAVGDPPADRSVLGGTVPPPAGGETEGTHGAGDSPDDASRLGERLLALVAEAEAAGVDAEGALRASVRRLEDAARQDERSLPTGPASSGASSDR